MSEYFPAFRDLRGRRCIVAGGGAVGERKVADLLRCGAAVTVVSPWLTPALAVRARAGLIAHRPRPFRRADVRGAALVIAATGSPPASASSRPRSAS